MFVVVAYDISNDRRRTRLHQGLKGFGQPVQYSVFECHVDEGQFKQMQALVKRTINHKEDLVRFYRLCAPCHARIIAINGRATTPAQTIII